MRQALLAAVLVLALPGSAPAADLGSYYTDRCWNDRTAVPEFTELTATSRGGLLWNGLRVDWTTFRAWLDDMLKKRAAHLYVQVADKMPHRGEIITILAKGGLVLHHCPAPITPVY